MGSVNRIVVTALCLAFCAACSSGDATPQPDPTSSSSTPAFAAHPGTDEGARKLVTEIRTATLPEKIQALRPATSDYRALFKDPFAAKAESYYSRMLWDLEPTETPRPLAEPDQTEVRIAKVTTDEIAAWTPEARATVPGGYEKIREQFKPGLVVYTWDYVRPGKEHGMAFNGLVHVNGRWVFVPKPWRVLE
jgi:hypothetical protein